MKAACLATDLHVQGREGVSLLRAVFLFVVAVLAEVVVVVLITAAGAVLVVSQRFRRRPRCFVGTVAALVVGAEAVGSI